jgi:hypothetical protein
VLLRRVLKPDACTGVRHFCRFCRTARTLLTGLQKSPTSVHFSTVIYEYTFISLFKMNICFGALLVSLAHEPQVT